MQDTDKTLQALIEENMLCNNYIIEKDKNCNQAVIYFSSRGLCGENDIELFRRNIVEKNKFEFYGTRIKNSKHIFLRDIRNNWYRDGINTNLNSREKLLEFLKEQTKGLDIITVGSSAGGYAALLYGNLLNAKKIFAFSPLPENANDEILLLENIKNSSIPSYVLCPSNLENDIRILNKLQNNKCIKALLIKSNVHGVPIHREVVKKIINSSDKKIQKLYSGKIYNERYFVIKYFGIILFIKRLLCKNLRKTANAI